MALHNIWMPFWQNKIESMPLKIASTVVNPWHSTRTHGIACLSLKGKIIRRKSHAQSIFIWEGARLALRQIISQIELTNRFNEVLDF